MWGQRSAAGGTTSEAGVLLLATGMRYELPRIEGDVRFEHVRFGYGRDLPEVLHEAAQRWTIG